MLVVDYLCWSFGDDGIGWYVVSDYGVCGDDCFSFDFDFFYYYCVVFDLDVVVDFCVVQCWFVVQCGVGVLEGVVVYLVVGMGVFFLVDEIV